MVGEVFGSALVDSSFETAKPRIGPEPHDSLPSFTQSSARVQGIPAGVCQSHLHSWDRTLTICCVIS